MLAAGLWLATPSAEDLTQRVAVLGSAAGARPLLPGQVPVLLQQAIVAAEDERFFSHHGLDTIGTARAVWDDSTQLCLCQGGSTITQQLAKAVYYPNDSRLSRKLPAIAIAYKIELHHSKAEILADYLSVVRFGYGLVGARSASCAYFGHDLVGAGAAQLTVAEAAELAGSVQAPTEYDPRYHSDLAEARRDYAIDRMEQVGFIGAPQAAAAKAAPVLAGGTGHPANCG
jgi:membrane peptidoglycan carboxypeptidase